MSPQSYAVPISHRQRRTPRQPLSNATTRVKQHIWQHLLDNMCQSQKLACDSNTPCVLPLSRRPEPFSTHLPRSESRPHEIASRCIPLHPAASRCIPLQHCIGMDVLLTPAGLSRSRKRNDETKKRRAKAPRLSSFAGTSASRGCSTTLPLCRHPASPYLRRHPDSPAPRSAEGQVKLSPAGSS